MIGTSFCTRIPFALSVAFSVVASFPRVTRRRDIANPVSIF